MTSNDQSLDGLIERVMPEPNTGCWIWMGVLNSGGYGVVKAEGRSVYAHRHSWRLRNGKIPDGLSILHKCDIRPCINPDHLYPGTPRQNSDDAISRGRTHKWAGKRARGANPNAKLSEANIAEIKSLLVQGVPQKEIANTFGISNPTVSQIKTGATWKE